MSGSSSPYPLEITLFGTWEVRVHGQPLPALRSRTERWLVALLVLWQDRPITREMLAMLLWPDSTESQALKYLRKSLSHLRGALGSEAQRILSPTSRTVRLDLTDSFCDVLAFDAALEAGNRKYSPQRHRGTGGERIEGSSVFSSLEEAVALYRGPLLPDCLENWAETDRDRREQEYYGALERLAAMAQTQAKPAEAARWLRLLIAAAPYRESAACSLMQTLADCGDRAAVTQVYQELRRRLRDQLNTSPAPETDTLYRQLCRQERPAVGLPVLPAPVVSSLRHLPVPLTELIGRESEIEEVGGWLQRSRLVTLLGPGGVGKTRLAIAAADALLPRFADGVWFVDFAPVQQVSHVAETVARALFLPEQPDRSPEAQLTEALASRSLLLVLDNCEHVQEASAALAYRLLCACSNLRILATSRHTLGITGEQVYAVPSLRLPPEEVTDAHHYLSIAEKDPASLMEFEGIRLFVQRATQAAPTFHLNRRNGAIVAAICRHLDGIPLAIEMAAARLKSLSVGDIHTRLSDRFRLLTTGSRVGMPRHQTLKAALDWSFDLLEAEERGLLCRLSVFAGGFALEGAAAVSRIETEACLDTLTSLVDKSLVTCEPGTERMRYRLLETVREYGWERLEAREREAVLMRYRAYCLHLAETAKAAWQATHDRRCLAELGRDYDNVRAALDYGLKAADPEAGYALLWQMHSYWQQLGALSEERRCWAAFLEQRGAELPRLCLARALYRCAVLANDQNDYERAQTFAQDASRWFQELEAWAEYAHTQALRGALCIRFRGHEASREYFEEAIAIWHRLGDRVNVAKTLLRIYPEDRRRLLQDYMQAAREVNELQEVVSALHSLSLVEYIEGNFAAAQTFSEEALQISQDLGYRFEELVERQHLGWIYLAQQQWNLARTYFLSTLPLQKAVERKQELMTALQALADIAIQQARWDYALVLYGITETMMRKYHLCTAHGRETDTETQLAKLREHLPPARFEALYQQGSAFSIVQAIEYSLEESS